MKLPTFKRLKSQDYPGEQQSIIEQLSFALNNGIEVLYEALNKKISIKDNLLATEKDVEFRVSSTGLVLNSTFINVDFGQQVRTVFVGKVENLTNPTSYPTSAVFLSWVPTEKGIQILHATGLTAGNSYRIRVVMYG